MNKQQLEELEAKRKRFKVQSTDLIEQDAEDESWDEPNQEEQKASQSSDSSEEEEERPKFTGFGKPKNIMHGATVVPEPAFIKHKKLLERK